MLKVIAGTARGRQLKTLPKEDFSIRPMLGMMKKSVFDIITPILPDSLFLDLYAGVGSVGIEALSRGAKRVVFAEISDKSIALVKYNLNMLGFEDRADIIKCDVVKGFPKFQNKYDIIFMGPPYKDGDKNLPFANDDYVFIPGVKKMIQDKLPSIKAYAVKKDGTVNEFELTVGDLTDDERKIILSGCLINYYRN